MKRITNIVVVMILCLSLLSMNMFAASATVSATGPQSVEAGEAIQVKLNLTATDVYAMSGVINYDASQLRLESAVAGSDNVVVTVNPANNKFTVYHTGGEYLATGTLIVLNFTVLEATVGTTVSVSFDSLVATDAVVDLPVSSATYTFTVAEPEPVVPGPTEPKPTEPKPTEPKPTEPKPTEPKPTEPAPTEPAPTEPKPTEPAPTEPKPTEPAPTVPDAANGDAEKENCWWCWILLLIAIALCTWHLIVVFKKKRKAQENT